MLEGDQREADGRTWGAAEKGRRWDEEAGGVHTHLRRGSGGLCALGGNIGAFCISQRITFSPLISKMCGYLVARKPRCVEGEIAFIVECARVQGHLFSNRGALWPVGGPWSARGFTQLASELLTAFTRENHFPFSSTRL